MAEAPEQLARVDRVPAEIEASAPAVALVGEAHDRLEPLGVGNGPSSASELVDDARGELTRVLPTTLREAIEHARHAFSGAADGECQRAPVQLQAGLAPKRSQLG